MARNRSGSRLDESSVFLKLSLFIISICTLLQIIGLATDHWIYIPVDVYGLHAVHHGLWKICGRHYGLAYCIDYGSDSQPDWHRAVQAMEILGVLGLGATLFGLTIGVCITGKKGYRILTVTSACVSAACVFIGVIIFGASTPDSKYLHYSFGLCVTAGILTLIAVGLMFVDLSRTTPPAPLGTTVTYNANGNAILFAGPPGYMTPNQTPYVAPGQSYIGPRQSPYNVAPYPGYSAPGQSLYVAPGYPPEQITQSVQNIPNVGQGYAEQPPPQYTPQDPIPHKT